MGQGFLVDTNAVIDYLNNRLPDKATKFINSLEVQFSVVTRIELLVWRNAPEEQLQMVKDFIDVSIVFNLSEDVVLQTIEIRKHYRLQLADAIIAATARVKNLTLITRNIKDFERVPNLNLLDPYQL